MPEEMIHIHALSKCLFPCLENDMWTPSSKAGSPVVMEMLIPAEPAWAGAQSQTR